MVESTKNIKQLRGVFRNREKRQGEHLVRSLLGHCQRSFPRPQVELRKLRRNARYLMNAHNPYSRALWFTMLAQEMARHLEGHSSFARVNRPLWFVTIIDQRQVIDPDSEGADEEAWRRVSKRKRNLLHKGIRKAWAEGNPTWAQMRADYNRCLSGFDCIGMLDEALYVSTRRVFHADRIISVHAHALVWNTSQTAIDALLKRVRSHMKPLLDYATSIDAKLINPEDFLQLSWYISKMPRKQYQVHIKNTKRIKQYKRDINGVNAVRLFATMSDVTLDQITFARGGGTHVLSRMLEHLARLKGR